MLNGFPPIRVSINAEVQAVLWAGASGQQVFVPPRKAFRPQFALDIPRQTSDNNPLRFIVQRFLRRLFGLCCSAGKPLTSPGDFKEVV